MIIHWAIEILRASNVRMLIFVPAVLVLTAGCSDGGGSRGPGSDYPPRNSESGNPPVKFVDPYGHRFVLIPGGSFQMGSDANRFTDCRPVHEVSVSEFYMSAYEVSKYQFRKFVEETGFGQDLPLVVADGPQPPNSDLWEIWVRAPGDQFPAYKVSWTGAERYCKWLSDKTGLSVRLPTEAEWEYACRGGTNSRYWWGDEFERRLVKWADHPGVYKWDSAYFLVPPGTFPRNPFGIYEILGNALEWTGDWYDPAYYEASPSVDPLGPDEGTERVIRGASYDHTEIGFGSAIRMKMDPEIPYAGIRPVFRLESDADRDIVTNWEADRVEFDAESYRSSLPEHSIRMIALPDQQLIPFVELAPGKFSMGSAEDENPLFRGRLEGPVTTVEITKRICVGQFEVTQKQWNALMGTTESRFRGDDLPVHNVRYTDIRQFLELLNTYCRRKKFISDDEIIRLPTECEWEFACRSGSDGSYSFGNDERLLSGLATYDCGTGPTAVGTRQPNRFGLFDMHGNVMEYCEGVMFTYPGGEMSNPPSKYYATTSMIAARGGSWASAFHQCRSAARFPVAHSDPYDFVGFRLVIAMK